MIRSSETVKILDIRVFFKLFPDTNFNTEITDMSEKVWTYGSRSIEGI